nr:hypothetical protein [Yoonia sp.]
MRQPLIDGASVDLRLSLDPFVVDIGQAMVRDGASRMLAQGRIAATDAGWQVAVDAVIDTLAPDRLRTLWPNGFRPGTRDWVRRNVLAGQLSDLHFGLRLEPGQPATHRRAFQLCGCRGGCDARAAAGDAGAWHWAFDRPPLCDCFG